MYPILGFDIFELNFDSHMEMGSRGFWVLICLFFLYLSENSMASVQNIGRLNLGFKGSQMTWVDNDGMILVSNNSNFGFGFNPTQQNVTLFLLVVMHLSTQTVIWSANRASPVQNSDSFVFDGSGNAYLMSRGSTVWSSNTNNKGVAAMELWDSGNLVLVRNDNSNVVWQSFSHPVDTLVSNQVFDEGMRLVSSLGSSSLTYSLEIKSGDMILSAGFNPPQPYWAMGKDNRITINKLGGGVTSSVLDVNSWKFYDKNKVLIWEFIFSDTTDVNATWIAVLGNNGLISFTNLGDSSDQPATSPVRIPEGECNTPVACDPYYVCYTGNMCQCPSSLPSCRLGIASLCSNPEAVELVEAGGGLGYFATGFVPPNSKTNLNGCKNSCLGNCTCAALFFDSTSGNCFLFDQIGSLQGNVNRSGIISYIKVLSSSQKGGESGSGTKHLGVIIGIVVLTILIVTGLIWVGIHYHKKRNEKLLEESPKDSSEEDNFLEGLSGMPVRFSYKELENATNDFSVKLGHGGFGSVYQGVLPDGTQVAVKKLEGIGQGTKEFRAEVSIIGRIHHLHLVKLKGFCAEGSHKLLVYEYMANGSLDKWLFLEGFVLDWNTRYKIALGTAKGLAYLHEDCDEKIVHCDIKPENVLLDDNFLAKVSDFGLAKLMTREQSHVFTTLRGTRGYLAPEWITNYAISEKSDVYSFGMVLLEITGGRKNYDSSQTSEKSHFPSFAFKMNEAGKLMDIVDTNMKLDEGDERAIVTAIRVALWCIQDDIYLRPSMSKVVQMLEGLCPVPPPPSSSPLGSRLYSCFFKSASEECTSSDCNSGTYISDVRLSGPR